MEMKRSVRLFGFERHPIARVALVLSAFLLATLPAKAQELTTNEAVARLFQEEVQADWFAEPFLAQVPVEQLDGLIQQLTAQFGALVAVEGEGGQLTTILDGATMPTQIALDEAGRIAGLFFGAPVPIGSDLAGFVADIAALPGETAVLVLTDGDIAAAHQADVALGVGSAFKLAVLAALMDDIDAGDRAWEDVVTLDPALRSLPTGILQTWPAGTPLTLATLANLMISASDNTATDALIALLGRERIEAETPRNTPFLTTADMFRLKAVGNEALAAEWIDGDVVARRDLLDQLAAVPLPRVADFPTTPTLLEAEWHMTATEICALLDRVGDNPALSINPGVADAGQWAHVAFKGGSEPGVLNLSTLVTAEDGTVHCVVVTWNNDAAALNETALISLYAGMLGVLAGG